jgi:cobaltochelatase CobN
MQRVRWLVSVAMRRRFTPIVWMGLMMLVGILGWPWTVRGIEPEGREVMYLYPGGPLVGKFTADEQKLGIQVLALTDEKIEKNELNLSSCRLIVIVGIRELNNKNAFKDFFASLKKQQPKLRIVVDARAYAFLEQNLPDLIASGALEKNTQIEKYSGFEAMSDENQRRLLGYLAITYLGRPGTIEQPEKYENRWFYHPDHPGTFGSLKEFLQWAQEHGKNLNAPRALVETNIGHILWMNQKIIDALVRESEKRGLLAVAMNTIEEPYEKVMREFKPDVLLLLTGKSGRIEFYADLGAPRLQPMFLMGESIDQWQSSENVDKKKDPTAARMGMMLVTRESQGVIEPRVVAGPLETNRDFSKPNIPIPARLERFVSRAMAYVRLAKKVNAEKKIAIQYLGPPDKGEMLAGTPDSLMAESVLELLKRMKAEGYGIEVLPRNPQELIEWMIHHGRQILSAAPKDLDSLARSGLAALVPVETYQRWFEAKVPKQQQAAVVKDWGAAPGKFMVWRDDRGKQFFVIPKIDLGNVILVPKQFPEIEDMLGQDVREALLARIKNDPYGVVPSHNELAANFWIEESFKADALLVWGFLIMDYTLPRKMIGLRDSDWPDILMGDMPNFRPWPVSELHWSLPARRRTSSVLLDHLTAPDTAAGLSDELLNLSNDILKWDSLPEGALESRFRASITRQVREAHLDRDLHFDLKNDHILTAAEVQRVLGYLNDIQHEKINTEYHVFGQPPPDNQMIPTVANCLSGRFLEGLAEVIQIPPGKKRLGSERKNFLRQKAEQVLEGIFRKKLSMAEAVTAAGGNLGARGLPEKLAEGIRTAQQLYEGFSKTTQEIENTLLALNGRFVPPGPGNLPERNPSVVPTGRNLYVMNPEEIPSRPSWELGKQLVDQLLAEQRKIDGRVPAKIGLSLDFRSTMMDYGVMESQILYLIGARPVWDASNRVVDVEIIPAKELGRPRIDVFIETYDYYTDYLESRLRLWDKAIRLVSALDEPGNNLFKNRARISKELQSDGVPAARAEILSNARIFAMAPEQVSFIHFLLLEKTGDWDSRRELVDVYLAERDYAYTEGSWGEKTPQVYRRQLQGTDVVLKNITRGGPLGGAWYNGGNLSLVIKELTGKDPDYFIADLRNPGEEQMVRAEDLLQRDFRATLLNRAWIEGMIKENYAGAQQIAGLVFSTLGWKINRNNSIPDDVWQAVVDIYLRDKLDLKIRDWFEEKNPYAFQGMTENLLEAVRKEYWRPDEATLMAIATAYAESVVRHGLRENGEVNEKLVAFLGRTMSAPGSESTSGQSAKELLEQFRQRLATELPMQLKGSAPTQEVTGQKLQATESERDASQPSHSVWSIVIIASLLILLLAIGLWKKTGAFRHGKRRSD